MIHLVKIGGNIIDDDMLLENFIIAIRAFSRPCVIVHGGGKIASEISRNMGVEPVMADGRRITDEKTLDIIVMVYAGLVNKKIVALAQKHGINAVGITGADANTILAKKRPAGEIDYGFVGDIEKVSPAFISDCLAVGLTPVIAPVTHDAQGNLLNTNADTIAASIGVALAASADVKLWYCFEKNGVLSDANDDESAIPELTMQRYSELLSSGIISKGMKPKLENAFFAKNNGVAEVVICHAEAFPDPFAGTTIYYEQ